MSKTKSFLISLIGPVLLLGYGMTGYIAFLFFFGAMSLFVVAMLCITILYLYLLTNPRFDPKIKDSIALIKAIQQYKSAGSLKKVITFLVWFLSAMALLQFQAYITLGIYTLSLVLALVIMVIFESAFSAWTQFATEKKMTLDELVKSMQDYTSNKSSY